MRIGEGGSALITDNHITHIRDTPFSGCQNGVAVSSAAMRLNTFGTGTVVHNLIDDYQKGGVVIDGTADSSVANSSAEVAYNEIVGVGPTAVIAQNDQIAVTPTRCPSQRVAEHRYRPTTTCEEIWCSRSPSPARDGAPQRRVRQHRRHRPLHDRGTARSAGTSPTTTSRTTASSPTRARMNNPIEHNKLTGNNEFDCDDVSAGPGPTPLLALVANRLMEELGQQRAGLGLCKHSADALIQRGGAASAPPPLLDPHGSRRSRATHSAATTAMIASFATHHWQIASMRAAAPTAGNR